jgi:hypothetical protein
MPLVVPHLHPLRETAALLSIGFPANPFPILTSSDAPPLSNGVDAIVIRMPISKQDRAVYEYALRHLRSDRTAIEVMILDVERVLRVASTEAPMAAPVATDPEAPAKKARKKRVMSEEGKARIAEAQRKRWARAKRAKKKEANTVLA